MKTNLMHCLSSVYFVNQPLHFSGIFVVHHRELCCIYTTICTCCAFQLTVCWLSNRQLTGSASSQSTVCCPANRQSTEKHSTHQLLYIYSIPPDDGLQICPKYTEVNRRNKLRINSASSWFSLHGRIEMHGQKNI